MTAYPKPKSKGRVGRVLILIALMIASISLVVERNLNQMMLDVAYAQAYSLAVETINQSVWDVMQGGVSYDELMTRHVDANGRLTMLNANTIRMNELATKTALRAESELSHAENQWMSIPVGAALGIRILAGLGPRVSFQMMPIGSVKTHFVTEFESAGINQTRHKISLILTTTVQLVVPKGSKRVDVVSTVLIAESIIVGDVPDSFVDVANQEDMLNLLP